MPSDPPDARPHPAGPDAVRAAVIDAAGRHFAARGLGAGLRDIARDAGVNLGLIHRYIGNKDDLLRAVLAARSDVGRTIAEETDDPADAVTEIFRATAASGVSVQTMAWLLLAREDAARFPADFPVIQTLRERVAARAEEAGEDPPDEVPLLAAFVLMFGWPVFAERLCEAFGFDPARTEELAERMARLAGDLVRTAPGRGEPPITGARRRR